MSTVPVVYPSGAIVESYVIPITVPIALLLTPWTVAPIVRKELTGSPPTTSIPV